VEVYLPYAIHTVDSYERLLAMPEVLDTLLDHVASYGCIFLIPAIRATRLRNCRKVGNS
jgi:hypothetical protein